MNHSINNYNSTHDLSQLNLLKKVLNVVTGDFSFARDEFLEVVYDVEGNRNFCLARHVKTFEELEELVRKLYKRCNVCYCPSVRNVPVLKENKRTGEEYVSRLKAIVFDVEDPDEHKDKNRAIDPSVVQGWIDVTLKDLSEVFQNATPLYTAYTGGGGQICFVLNAWLSRQEAETLFQFLADFFKSEREKSNKYKYVDLSALKVAQPLRLIGTRNQTRGVNTFFFEVNENPDPLKADDLFSLSHFLLPEKRRKRKSKKAGKRRKEKVEKNWETRSGLRKRSPGN